MVKEADVALFLIFGWVRLLKLILGKYLRYFG